jgi:tRNA-binding EMAP/Myf-like protein
MSELLVNVVEIREVKPHPNADRLEIAVIDGWEIISGKGNWKVGDWGVHVPPESMVLKEYADEWGVTPYLSFKGDGRAGRVKAARLRGIVSFGFLVPAPEGVEIGEDLRRVWEIEKYEPPEVSLGAGQMSNEDPLFFRYTNIANLRNEVAAFDPKETHVVTEKLHGTNSRVGWIRRENPDYLPLEIADLPEDERHAAWRDNAFELVCGSHKRQVEVEQAGLYGLPIREYGEELNRLRDLVLETLDDTGLGSENLNSLIVYGEIFGPGVQDMQYGFDTHTKGYRVFDISLNGHYLSFAKVAQLCQKASLETVPVLFIGELTLDEAFAFAEGNTTINDADQIREGVVIRPTARERSHRNGRYIFKIISGSYLARKGGTENH